MNHINFFKNNGVTTVRSLFDKTLINECLKTAKKIKKNFKIKDKNKIVFENDNKSLKYYQNIEIDYPIFFKLQNSMLLEFAKKLLGQNVYFSSMGLHNKAPGKGTFTPLHQDNFYHCLKPAAELTAYIPLERQDDENGQIYYYKKTHNIGIRNHVKSKTKAFSSEIENKLFLKNKEIFKSNLKPGDVTFHHTNVVHGAQPNRSKSRSRYAVAIAILGVKAKLDIKQRKIYSKFLKYNRK